MNVSIEDRVLPTEHGDVFTRRWRTGNRHKTPIVLLHDSLGCVELWRDFPERLAATTSRDVIAYDRLGFGRSAAHPGGWTNQFVRDEADRFFPPVWQALDFEHFIAFGHSAGGIMATRLASCYPRHCRALITESAQAFVEDRTLQGIREARTTFTQPEQLARLRKYHGDKVRWILRAWFDTWLSDSYAAWTLADSAPGFSCPLLTIHGLQDEYGSVAHPRCIAALASGPTRELLLDHCWHVPHREHPRPSSWRSNGSSTRWMCDGLEAVHRRSGDWLEGMSAPDVVREPAGPQPAMDAARKATVFAPLLSFSKHA